MGSPGADGNTCGRDVHTKAAKQLSPAKVRKIMDTLRASMGVNDDKQVLRRAVEMKCKNYKPRSRYWSRAIKHDIQRYETTGFLPPYVEDLYNEHMAAPQK
jgi:hypothetical protein